MQEGMALALPINFGSGSPDPKCLEQAELSAGGNRGVQQTSDPLTISLVGIPPLKLWSKFPI
jgi:hypothetical protein